MTQSGHANHPDERRNQVGRNGEGSWRLFMETIKYKTALIVGAGEGLSASLARLFTRGGIHVALAARQTDKLAALCTETGATAYACDATSPDDVTRLFAAIERDFGAPDVVVYNAGARLPGAFVDLIPADVEKSYRCQRVRRLSGCPTGNAADAPQQAWRHSFHRCIGEREGLSAVRSVRDG